MGVVARDVAPGRLAPRWVIAADLVTVVALLLAASVFSFGGARDHLGPLRISVRSWDRLAIWPLALTFVRHVLVRRPAMPVVVWSVLRRFWSLEERRAVWPVFLTTRLGVLLVGYLAVVTIGLVPGSERFRISENELENLVARWDAGWYRGIASSGYSWNGNRREQQNVVFFPAFPSLMWLGGLFMGKRWLLAGTILAVSAFFCALLYLYRLGRDSLEPDRAQAAVWLLAAYPFSVYYSAPYTEGFYLLGAVAAFYHATREQWWRASGWGCFLALCRPNGFLIAAPLGALALARVIRDRRIPLSVIAAVTAPVLGLLTYCAFLYLRFGDPLAWTKGQLAWGRAYVGFWEGAWALFRDRYEIIANEGFYGYSSGMPYDLLYTASAIFVLASVWPTVRRFGPAFGLFTLLNIVPPLVMGGMMSIGRMTSVLFPAFLWLGAIVPPRQVPAWAAGFCLLQGLVAALFFTWRPIF